MFKIGLKLWSVNTECLDRALRYYYEKIFDYIELYVVPGSAERCLEIWRTVNLPYVLHAPHSYSGFNLSLKGHERNNRRLIEEVELFRAALKPDRIIIHPGINGNLDETIRQIHLFRDVFPDLFEKVLIENKPKIGLRQEICVGASPEEIEEIIAKTGVGFCLDIGHAMCYSAWSKEEYEGVFDRYLKLGPGMYHLSDGNRDDCVDSHLNLGCGDYDILNIVGKVPKHCLITIETKKEKGSGIGVFKKEALFLKELSRTLPHRILFLGGNIATELSVWLQKKGETVVCKEGRISIDEVMQIKPDMIVSYNYTYLIPAEIINYVTGNVVNLHISFLPWNRGADPNIWSFLEDSPKGVTIHYIDEGIDSGDIIVQKEVCVDENRETLKSSYEILHREIQALFKEHWGHIKNNEIISKPQMSGGTLHFRKDSSFFEPFIKDSGWNTPIGEFKKKYNEWRLKSCSS